MNTRLFRTGLIAAALMGALSVSVPALADGHGHGGGGGGGRFASGGFASHGGAPAGARVGGGRVGMAPPARMGGFPGSRASGPVAAYGGHRYVSPPANRFGYSPRGNVYRSPRFVQPLYGRGYGGRPRYWNGGYYRGTYWPRSYYHAGFVRFVPVLPAFYSTFWFGGVPYYYWDDTYYTWSPSDYGYVATDPPPAADSDTSDGGSAQASDSSSLYVYPKNGQSEEQTSTDRYECHQWAAGQTGFDPTKGADQSAGASGPGDYRRAMMACLDARGYSAR